MPEEPERAALGGDPPGRAFRRAEVFPEDGGAGGGEGAFAEHLGQ